MDTWTTTTASIPFFVLHRQTAFFISLSILLFVVLLLLFIYQKSYAVKISTLAKRNKYLYDEYRVVSDNMPIALLTFDRDGFLIDKNMNSSFIFPDKYLGEGFNIYTSSKVPRVLRTHLKTKGFESKTLTILNKTLRFIFKQIDENEGFYLIVMDYTAIEKERLAKERVYSAFNYAMDASSIGVAKYSFTKGVIMATTAWYDNLYINKNTPLGDIHRAFLPRYKTRIDHFIKRTKHGVPCTGYSDIVRVRNNQDNQEVHWVKYVNKVMKRDSLTGEIVICELLQKIDAQKATELNLKKALRAAKESERMKNAFVANMTADIRPMITELSDLSSLLVGCSGKEERAVILEEIQRVNDELLRYVDHVIEQSQINDQT